MSDLMSDHIEESRVKVLGLSPEDFKKYLIESGITTALELSADSRLIQEFMSSELWMTYEEDREEAYLAKREDEKFRYE